MKNRILPAIGIILVSGSAIYFGGLFLNIVLLFIIAVSCYEFCAIRTNRFNIILIFVMITFILSMLLVRNRQIGIMIAFIIFLFMFAIFTPEITTDDIASCFLMSIIITFAMQSILSINNKAIIAYIVIAAFLTDVGAFLVGMKFGKHKLIERISPKKTIEGAIGGYIIGFITSFLFAYFFKFFGVDPMIYLFFSATLPIVSQVGDLAFSMIKRTYGVKDFGSILLGHGGILDRCDSLFFCLIFYVSMMGFIF